MTMDLKKNPYKPLASIETKVRKSNIALIAVSVVMSGTIVLRMAAGVTGNGKELFSLGEGLLGLLQFVIILVSLVFFFMFIHRAHRNLPSLGAEKLTYTPGWSVGWFFIPVANLVQPYRVVQEIWKSSAPRGQAPGTGTRPSESLIALWWAFWLISNFAGYAVFRLSLKEGMENSPLYDGLYVASDLLNILSSVFIIRLVSALRLLQESRAREMAMDGTIVVGADAP